MGTLIAPGRGREHGRPTIAVFMLFAGFLITRGKIPNWLIEFSWLWPFPWSVRSTAQNELYSARWTDEEGVAFLKQPFQIPTERGYKWAGVGYLPGQFLLFASVSALLPPSGRGSLSARAARPTRRQPTPRLRLASQWHPPARRRRAAS